MPSITYWNRLIPQPLGTSLDPGLAAQARDPLWTLARQLQMGEFLGTDGGSPAFVDMGTRTTVFDRANRPLEPTVEGEEMGADLSVRAELGQILETLIEQMVSPTSLVTTAKVSLRSKYPLPSAMDAAGQRFLSVCAGKVSDGAAIYKAFVQGQTPIVDATTDAALKPALVVFAAWVADVFGNLGTAASATWDVSELGYSFSLSGPLPDGRSASLIAEPDRAADLEWYAFDVGQTATASEPAPLVTQSLIPAHVSFRGMPNDRFWDFESNKTEFGNVVADVPDAGRLLFLDFMLIHGLGWYIAPLDVSVGSLCQVDFLTVHDVFGGATSIPRADATLGPAGNRFTLFSTTDRSTGGVASVLFAAPSCAAATQSSVPIEDVRVFRDDAAELAWAVEDVAPDTAGNPTPGEERGRMAPAPPPPILFYQLETPIPPAWFPLLPLESGGALVDFALASVAPGSAGPWGRIVPGLAAVGSSGIPEQAVPRAGLRLQRVFCRSRWIDGSTYLWTARRRLLGARGSSSGLVYDRVFSGTS